MKKAIKKEKTCNSIKKELVHRKFLSLRDRVYVAQNVCRVGADSTNNYYSSMCQYVHNELAMIRAEIDELEKEFD